MDLNTYVDFIHAIQGSSYNLVLLLDEFNNAFWDAFWPAFWDGYEFGRNL